MSSAFAVALLEGKTTKEAMDFAGRVTVTSSQEDFSPSNPPSRDQVDELF